ncbi:MAG: hypothetical protein COS85_10525 [Armatimonadetes bacterium CG07_land_8_20_14_0_80_59_28]|nr:MAG: hypothetical protein COS85_10525 [Armatimonadetes bacterium CG07_land_8_20_14_0_80_59_28]PIX38983.1 MAG: hypothetical protein COZ56_18960 [Armatimonadetes bacterium CG_4_8_14_3_um_filter_58_9]PIY44478.1 MAG: hypothetical protein COZ05_08095 [Armatimonadetes bacterium CG_4_10_14_3_um_filter_59_10]
MDNAITMLSAPCSVATGTAWLRRVDARVKWLATIATILLALSIPVDRWPGLAFLGVALLALLCFAGVALRTLGARLAFLLPFLLLSVINAFWKDDPSGSALVFAKAVVCMLAVMATVLTTPLQELMRGLYSFRVPELLITLALFMARFLVVLYAEALAMQRAYLCRCGTRRGLREAKNVGALIGSLFLRAYHRADRIHAAMLSRNFDGRFLMHSMGPLPWRDVVLLACVLGGLALFGVAAQ